MVKRKQKNLLSFAAVMAKFKAAITPLRPVRGLQNGGGGGGGATSVHATENASLAPETGKAPVSSESHRWCRAPTGTMETSPSNIQRHLEVQKGLYHNRSGLLFFSRATILSHAGMILLYKKPFEE